MSDFNWDMSGKHPPPPVLLLHQEGELGSRESAAVDRHMAECWECRAQADLLRRGICEFMGYRQRVLLPPIPPPPRRRLHKHRPERMGDAVSWFSTTRVAWRAFKSRRIAVTVAAAVAIMLAAMIAPKMLISPLGGPPTVSAAEFLRQARGVDAAVSFSPRTAVHQTLEIRLGGRRFQHQIVRGKQRQLNNSTPLPLNLPQLPPVDWSDPLGAEEFAAWHDSLPEKADVVKPANGTVTLTTTALHPGGIVGASLTVRGSDWHAITKTVTVPDGPELEIREVAYELRPLPEPTSSSSSAPIDAPAVPGRNAVAEPAQTDWRMEESELALREVLFQIGADVQEAPRIWKAQGSIHLSASVESENRARMIRQAVAGMRDVRAEIHGPGAPITPDAQGAAKESPGPDLPPTFYVTQPPLAEQLWRTFDGMDSANQYLADLGTAYADLLASVSALDRFAKRYPEAEIAAFPRSLLQRVDKLTADQIVRVRNLSRQYVGRLDPVLEPMVAPAELAKQAPGATPGCGQWRTIAPAVAVDLRNLHRTFRRLFVPERVEEPVRISAPEALQETIALRTSMIGSANRLCFAEPSPP
jgi:hypothetical protein